MYKIVYETYLSYYRSLPYSQLIEEEENSDTLGIADLPNVPDNDWDIVLENNTAQ